MRQTNRFLDVQNPLAKLAAVLLLIVGLTAAGLQASELRIFFGPREPGDSEGLETQLITLIEGARERLDGSVHELRLQAIVDALLDAHRRGVRVRLVTEDRYFGNSFIRQLLEAGVPVRHDGNPGAIMHDKFLVADGEKVFTGSFNFTDTCAFKNYNDALLIADREVAEVYEREFELLWEGRFYDGPRDDRFHRTSLKVDGRDVPVEIFFQPRNSRSEERVLEILGASRRSIHVMQFAFFNGNVARLLAEKHRAGQTVRVVIDYSMVFGELQPLHQIKTLVSAGIPFSIGHDVGGKMHHKAFVVDADTDDATVVTGSANASSAGYGLNVENIIVLKDRKIAAMYRDRTERLISRLERARASSTPQEFTGVGRAHRLDLQIETGGEPIDDLEITLPFHWQVGSLAGVSARRGDGVELNGHLTLSDRTPSRYEKTPVRVLRVEGANLAAGGEASKLMVSFGEVRLHPWTRPGAHVIYMRGRRALGEWANLGGLPIVRVHRSAPEDLGTLARLLESPDVWASRELSFLVRDLRRSLSEAIERRELTTVRDFVSLAEEAKKGGNPRFSHLVGLFEPLARKLAFDASPGASSEASALAHRLSSL